MEEPSMLMGLTERMAGLVARGVAAPLPVSDAGEGKITFALWVGESGVGKPGYFRPTSVRSENFGLMASGCGRAAFTAPILNTGPLFICVEGTRKLAAPLIDPSNEGTYEGSWVYASSVM
jgi:hypothetical protein